MSDPLYVPCPTCTGTGRVVIERKGIRFKVRCPNGCEVVYVVKKEEKQPKDRDKGA